MSVNDPFLFGLNMVEFFAIPIMIGLFVLATWYGIVRGADGSPVLWGNAAQREAARSRAAAEKGRGAKTV